MPQNFLSHNYPAVGVSGRLCLAILLWLTVAVSAPAQDIHTLRGKVITPAGTQPVAPVRVTLTYNGRRIYETFTDLSGHFTFSGLGKGNYQLTAEGDGLTFETTTVFAEVGAFGSAPQSFTQDIQLRPIQGKAVTRAAVVNAFSQTIPKPAQSLFDQAVKRESEGKHEDAIALLGEALKIFPEYFEAHLLLGKLYSNSGLLEQATVELDRAREISPKDERVYQLFGLVLMRQKNFPVAVAVFSEAIRMNAVNPLNVMLKTTALIHQAYAIDAASSAKATDDKSYILSRAESSLKQLSEMSENRLKPDHLSLAMFYEMKNERRRAADELEQYLKENPGAQNQTAIRQVIEKLRAGEKQPEPPPN